MSLALFENYLKFAEGAVAAKNGLPAAIDPAEFESALVSYGVVLLFSHMEQCFHKALDIRCSRVTDPEVLTLLRKVLKEKAGKTGIEAVKGTLHRFSPAYKTRFVTELNTSGLESSWESIMTQRERVAHYGLPALCSLLDLRNYYEDVRKILGFMCNSLSLNPAEVTVISTLIVSAAVVPTPLIP
jgi:hypothetical protein